MIRQALLRVLGPVTANVLAAVTFVVAIGTGWRWLTLALVLLTLAVTVVKREGDGLGQFTIARAVTAASALALHVRLHPDVTDWWFNAAALLTVAYTTLEGVLDKVSTPAIDARHLSVARPPLHRLVNRASVYLADTALIALVVVAIALDAPTWLTLVAALLAGPLFGGLVLGSIYHKVRRNSGLSHVRRELTRYQPDFLIYWDAGPESLRQVLMWLPFLERVGRPFAVVVRHRKSLRPLVKITDRPVILAPTTVAVDAATVPSLRAVFYVNNGMENAHMVRFAELTHVQLLHGDSEKANSFNPVTAMFDQIFVAGQAGIDRYAANGVHIPAEKFRVVGRPQVASIAVTDTPIGSLANKTVLYAPTWVGNFGDTNHCSLVIGDRLLKALLARPDVTVIMRHHQLTPQNAKASAHLAAYGGERVVAEQVREHLVDVAQVATQHVRGREDPGGGDECVAVVEHVGDRERLAGVEEVGDHAGHVGDQGVGPVGPVDEVAGGGRGTPQVRASGGRAVPGEQPFQFGEVGRGLGVLRRELVMTHDHRDVGAG